MAEFTKERLQEITEDGFLKHGEAKAMARQLLSGLEQEPVILYRERNPYNGMSTGWIELTPDEYDFVKDNASDNADFKTVYAAPQLPQPAVVPDEIESTSGSDADDYYCDGWNACRAAMLQGAEPVSQPYTLRDGWVAVPADMTPDMMRAVQLNSELGAYAAANLSGAYSLFREFWDVAVKSAPNQEAK